MENIRLTNGNETFMCPLSATDNLGPIRVMDSAGMHYNRCDIGSVCEHEFAPEGATVWHDEQNTEELWEAK